MATSECQEELLSRPVAEQRAAIRAAGTTAAELTFGAGDERWRADDARRSGGLSLKWGILYQLNAGFLAAAEFERNTATQPERLHSGVPLSAVENVSGT